MNELLVVATEPACMYGCFNKLNWTWMTCNYHQYCRSYLHHLVVQLAVLVLIVVVVVAAAAAAALVLYPPCLYHCLLY